MIGRLCRLHVDHPSAWQFPAWKGVYSANPPDAVYTYFSIFPMIRMNGMVLPKSKET